MAIIVGYILYPCKLIFLLSLCIVSLRILCVYGCLKIVTLFLAWLVVVVVPIFPNLVFSWFCDRDTGGPGIKCVCVCVCVCVCSACLSVQLSFSIMCLQTKVKTQRWSDNGKKTHPIRVLEGPLSELWTRFVSWQLLSHINFCLLTFVVVYMYFRTYVISLYTDINLLLRPHPLPPILFSQHICMYYIYTHTALKSLTHAQRRRWRRRGHACVCVFVCVRAPDECLGYTEGGRLCVAQWIVWWRPLVRQDTHPPTITGPAPALTPLIYPAAFL